MTESVPNDAGTNFVPKRDYRQGKEGVGAGGKGKKPSYKEEKLH